MQLEPDAIESIRISARRARHRPSWRICFASILIALLLVVVVVVAVVVVVVVVVVVFAAALLNRRPWRGGFSFSSYRTEFFFIFGSTMMG